MPRLYFFVALLIVQTSLWMPASGAKSSTPAHGITAPSPDTTLKKKPADTLSKKSADTVAPVNPKPDSSIHRETLVPIRRDSVRAGSRNAAAVVTPPPQKVSSAVSKSAIKPLHTGQATVKPRPAKKEIKRLSGLIRRKAVNFIILLVSIVIIGLTIEFFFRKKEGRRFMTTTRLSIVDKEVQLACRYIEKNWADPGLSAQSAGATLITGPAFLELLFQKELGMTFDDFVAQVRINRSRIAFEKEPSLTAEELSSMNGFSTVKAFLDAFSAITGLSFTEYQTRRLQATGKHHHA
jgi:AraC-like DNA-binding protein